MPAYVGLLRGINVGGKNKVPMAELRSIFEQLGCADVQTYIQSGNVVFTSGTSLTNTQVEAAIAETFGLDITVVLRTASALAKVVKANPFPHGDPRTLHVGFMTRAPSKTAVAQLESDNERFLPEEFAVRGTELYLFLPNGMGQTKLPAYLDRKLKIPTTVRNWRTVNKLAELARS
ncbi:MAG: hypothetical protein JWL83_3002 [Actinomycetia bacterium]|nr:hypothetical protein [Actinomycetes bacterium]